MIAKTKALIAILALLLQHSRSMPNPSAGYYVPVTHKIQLSQTIHPKLNKKAVDCLAKNIYFEAGNQPKLGMVAVAYVTLNRAHFGGWPHNVCSVVHEKHQFSWTSKHPKLYHNWQWLQAKRIAFSVYMRYNRKNDPTGGATYYHANYVRPVNWSGRDRICPVKRIGAHIFYRRIR